MAIDKIQSESINLADNFAFTGTVTGAGGVNEVLFFAYKSSSDGQQSISGNSNTLITLPTELYDTANAFTSNTFTVPSGKGGYYYLQGKMRDDFTSGQARYLMIYKNDSNYIQSREYSYGTTRHYTHVSGVINLSAGDTIKLYCAHTDSGARNIDGTNELETSLMGYKLNT
jgi:hypothetical protein